MFTLVKPRYSYKYLGILCTNFGIYIIVISYRSLSKLPWCNCTIHPKMKILSFLTLKLFQTCMSFLLTQKDILKNVGNQTVDGIH